MIFSISARIVDNSLYYSILNLYISVPTGTLDITLNASTSYDSKFTNIYSSLVKSTPLTLFYRKNSFFLEKLSNGSLRSTFFFLGGY